MPPVRQKSMAESKVRRPVRLNVFRVDAAVVAAQARGFFAPEGIELKITQTPNSTEQMRGISKGGYEIVAVAQTTDKLLLPVFVRPEIRDWSELKGKKLAVDAVDTAFALVLRRILLSHGLDLNRKDYELVPAGATGHRLDSMIRGETFAAILNAPFDAKAEAAGLVGFADHLEVLPHYPGGVYAVNRSWAKSNRETLVAFLRAWLAAGRWVRDPANREEAVNLVAAELKLAPKAAAGSVEDLSTTGSLNIPGLESALGLSTEFGFTPPMGAAVASYYNLDYYRAAARK